ncbi:MAG: GNAT family N-acetyltransferase [Propylenella sp.]
MTTQGPTIRDAREADIAPVRALLVETWHDTYDALIGAAKVTEITDSWHSLENLNRQLSVPNTTFLVADEGGTIAGHLFANAQKPAVLFVTRLYVLPSRQRRGIGRGLLAVAADRHPDCDRMRLEAKAGNEAALAFYRREGFAAVATKVVEGIDHLEMEKRLSLPA